MEFYNPPTNYSPSEDWGRFYFIIEKSLKEEINGQVRVILQAAINQERLSVHQMDTVYDAMRYKYYAEHSRKSCELIYNNYVIGKLPSLSKYSLTTEVNF